MPLLPFIPFANCAEVVFQGDFDGAEAFITIGVEGPAPFTPETLEDLGISLGAWWDDHLSNEVTGHWVMPSIKLTALDSNIAPSIIYSAFEEHAGQAAGPEVSDAIAMITKFTTDSRGRSYRGRNYVPSHPTFHLQDPSTWSVVAAEAQEAAYVALGETLDLGGWTHVILSRYNNNVRREVGVATPVTGYVAVRKIAVQRRRIRGTGA